MATLEHPGFALELDEEFAGPSLDRDRWLPYYLPHWSDWDRTAARYALPGKGLELRIEADQPPWCPALDGQLRVSSLQTALVAGAVGSTTGTHPFDPPATVRDGPHDVRLHAPTYGRFEARLQASADPRLMVAFWMIGLGDAPERTAEICVAEIFGTDVGPAGARIGVGVHPHRDPAVVDDFERVNLPIDATAKHDYATEWRPDAITFFVDGEPVKQVTQAIAYPMTLLLSLYEFPPAPDAAPIPDQYPKRVIVERVRCFRWLG